MFPDASDPSWAMTMLSAHRSVDLTVQRQANVSLSQKLVATKSVVPEHQIHTRASICDKPFFSVVFLISHFVFH